MQNPIPIVDAIEAVAVRLDAPAEQAWSAIKAMTAAGRLTLEGTDEKGRPCPVERHWITYIGRWGRDDPDGHLWKPIYLAAPAAA